MPYTRSMSRRNRQTGMVTPITPGNVARQALFSAAASAIPYGRTAMNVYRAARTIQSAYRGYRARQAQREAAKNARNPRQTFQFSGRYAGKFRKPKKSKKVSIAKKLGSVLSNETYGKCDDPDLVTIGHNTWPWSFASKSIAYAVFRKLFKKAINYDCQDIKQEMPLKDYNDAAQYRIQFVWKDEATGTITVTYVDGINNMTFESLGAASMTVSGAGSTDSFVGAIQAKFDNETMWNTRALERVMLRYRGGGTADFATLCDMNMHNEVLKLSVYSSIKLQNRTLAAGAASADTDRVDTQPIKGRLLKFSGIPKPRNQHVPNNLFATAAGNTGVTLVRGAQLPTGHGEPYVKQDFNNCYASTSVSLQPGEIKSSKIGMKKGAYFNNLFKSVRQITGGGWQSAIPGTTELFFFEEVLNSGSSNLITINYEQQLYVSCYLVTGKSPSMNTNHTQVELNNTTA